MGKTKNKLLIILMLVVLLATACGLLLSACVEDTFTVVLDANGGSFEGGGTTLVLSNLKVGDSIDLSLYAPTRGPEYELEGWVDNSDNEYGDDEMFVIPKSAKPGSSIVLSAQWSTDSGESLSALQVLNHIIAAMTNGDNLHSEYSTTLSVPDGSGKTTKYSIEFASNVKRGITGQGEYDYDIGFVVRDVTNNKGVVGIYVTDEYGVPGGLYVDTDPDDPEGSVFLLEDFNADYLLALVEKAPSVVPDAINGLLAGLMPGLDLFNIILGTALKAEGSLSQDDAGNNVYTMSFNPRALTDLGSLIDMVAGLVPALSSLNLSALFSYLDDIIPDSTFTLTGTVDKNGNLIKLGTSFVNHETGEALYDIKNGAITITDRNEDRISLIPAKVQNHANTYSFGHIQMSAAVKLGTQQASGGAIDIASLINTFVPGTLPEGILTLDADLDYRLDLAIDLDIAQKPYSEGEDEENIKDESVIAIEIKDNKTDAVMAGVYYKEGYIYVNIGQVLGGLTGATNLWQGKGFKIPFDLPSLIKAVKDVAIKYIDGFFGTDHGMITGETDTEALSSVVTGLAMAQDGNVYISQDWANLIGTVLAVLKINGGENWVDIVEGPDYDTLTVTIDKALIDSVLKAVAGFGADISSVQIPDFGTGTIAITSGADGLRDLTIGFNSGGLDLQIMLDKLTLVKPIEKGDKTFAEYVDGVIGEGEYTSSINDLVMSTLSGGLKGSIGLDVSFNEGTYNIGDLLAVFGLDLGDLRIEVESNPKLDLTLEAGIAIDETDYAKSSLYLKLNADENFTLASEGEDYIIKKGTVLGIYLYNNEIIIDVSGLTILGIKLPVYKISSEDLNAAELIATLLANIPEMDLAIDLSGVIESLEGAAAEQASLAASVNALSGGNGTVVRSSARAANNDLINITAHNDLLQVTATLTAVLNMLDMLGLNIDFDASQFLQGEASIDISFENGKLTAGVQGNLLMPEEGGNSNLSAEISLDLKNDWQIGGKVDGKDLAEVIADTVYGSLPEGWESADDALLDGLIDTLFNSTLELSLTVPDAEVAITNLLGEVFALIPNMSVDLDAMFSALDLGIVSEQVKLAIRAELYKKDGVQAIKLAIAVDDDDASTPEEPIVEVMLTHEDILYINLDYFGLGKYQVVDVGLMGLLDNLLSGLTEDLSLGSLLGGLIDFSGGLNFKAYYNGSGAMLRWNKYGAASSVYYKVYAGADASAALVADTGADDQTGLTAAVFDEQTGIYSLALAQAAEQYFIQVYTKLPAAEGAEGKEQTMFDAAAETQTYAPDAATASYTNINAVTFTWQAKDPFGGAETYALYDANGEKVTDIVGATYDASTFTYTYTVDLTGKTGPYAIYVNGASTFAGITPVMIEQGQSVGSITVSISEMSKTATWASVAGATFYVVTATASDGSELWSSKVNDNGKAFNNVMWGGDYSGYTVTVTAYASEGGDKLAEGSASASASGGILDTIAPLLSALAIKGNVISLNLTRELVGELISTLTGGSTVTLVDLNITKLDIFKGSLDLTLGIYEDASMDDGAGYNISGSLSLSTTVDEPEVDKGDKQDYSDYKDINLLYGAGLTESVIGILSDGISVEADLNINVAAGDYNVVNIIGPFLPDSIADYLGDELIWTVGTNASNIEVDLGVYASLDESDLDKSGFMVRIAFPNGVSLSSVTAEESELVAGDGFIIRKGAAITVAVTNNTLIVDLSAITILGVTLPVYKIDNFDLAEFVEGYLVQLEQTVANMYNDGNGMMYLADKSSITAGADKVDFKIAFDYIGEPEFEVVYFDASAENAAEVLLDAEPVYDEETTTHTVSGSYNVAAAAGDYIAVYALDTLGNRYDCLKLVASGEAGAVTFAPAVSAQTLALEGSGRFENYINIDPTKLQLIVTSQAIFSLLAQVVDIPASISSMEFDVEIGVGEPNEGAEKSIWANLDGTFDGKAVKLGLSADIGIGGEVDGMTIPEFIQSEFGKVPNIYENEYPTKLLSGILDEVLTSKLTLSLTAEAAEEQGFDLLGVVNQLVGGLVSFGDTTLDLIAGFDGEPVGIDLELALDGKMAESDVDLNMISLKVNYVTSAKTTTLIGIYVYQGSVWLDLSGIGMGAVEVEASGTIEKLTAYLGGLIDGLNINGTKINMDLGSILDLIAEGGTYPFGDALSPVESVAGADGDASADTADTTKNIVRAIVAMVSVEYANIKIDLQKTIINELLSLVQGASLSLNAEAHGHLDIFAGKGEIEATIKDSVSDDGAALMLMLGLEIGKTPATAAADLGKYIETLKAVTIDLDDMDDSVVKLLNALDASLDLNVTAKGGTTDIWKLVAPIIDNVVSSSNQNVVDALNALKEKGVDWTINATNIELSLALASDLKLDESGALDLEESALAVGIIAQTPLALGNSSPILNTGEGIYISIYKGSLYIDLSDVKLLGLEFPVLKVENFDVMSYLNDIVNMVSDKVGELLAQLPAKEQAAAMLALAEGDESAVDTSASLELRSDLTLTVALGAITQILKDTSIIDLTGLNYLPWEIELTTAAGEGNQLKLSLNNTQIEDSAYKGTGLEASLTLSAGFRELDVKDTNDLRNTLITYVRGNGTDEKDVATRFENYSGDLINEVLNSVLGSSLTLELGGSSKEETFDLKYALNGILDLLGMEGIDADSGYFNIDTSANVKYRLNLILDGSADDLSELNAYIGIEMKSGSETEWKTAIGIYLNNGDVYLDLTAIRNGALGGGVIKVTGSSIMDLAESEISKLLSSINVDLNELLKLTYDPDWNKPVDEQANAPSLSVSSMPIGTLVKYLVQIVSLQDLGVALDAHTTVLQELTEALFGTKIDFVEASGNLLLVDGTLDLDVKIGSAAFGGETKPENVYTFGAKLAINPDGNATFNEKFDLKGKGVTELDLTSGATLSETIVGLLGNLSLDLNVDLDLPGGVFGIGDLLNSFGIVDGGLTDSNGLDLIFEPLYKNDSIDAQGGMKLGLTLSLRLALDYNDPENTLAMLNLSFDEDLVMGIGEDGNDKVVIESGDLLTVIIDGTDLYVDMSNLTLLGITMPAYHASNFDISSFVTYVLDNALENTDLIIYGDIYVGCESVENGVQVSWSPVSGADEYVVSYTTAAGEEKEQTVKHDEKTTKYTLTITDALPEVYEVTVTAYEVITGEGDKEERVFIKSGTGTNSFSIASAPQANEEGEGGFIVSWNRVPGADMYYVYLNGSEEYAQQTALSVWVPAGTTEVKIVPQAFDEKDEAYKPIEGVIGRIELGGQSEQSSFAEGDDEGAASTIRDPFELTENEAMFIGVTKNDIAAIVSFTAVEAFLNLFGLEADLGNYDATIDLTISRDDVDESGNEDWMKLHFVGTLDEDMYYEGAQTEGTVTISNVAIGGTPKWMREVKFKADMIAQNAENAGNMLIEGIIEQVLNLSASLELKVEAENMLAIGNILAYIFEQTDLDLELGDIMLDLKGLNVGIDLNLAIDPDDHANSKFTAEISDAGSDEKLIGLYLVGYDVVLDLSGISLGRFAVTDSGLPDLIYGIVDDLLTTISEIDIDLDTIVDTLYGLVDDAFSGSSDNTNNQSLAVPEFNVTGALSGYGFGKQGDKYVNVSVNGDTTTFTWSRYLGGTHYVVELYNGYDNAKVNLIEQALTDTAAALGGVIVDGDLILPANVTSVSVQTSVLNNIGLIADAGSKYNGAEYPAYYVFLVRAGSYNSDTGEFTPSVLSGKEVYASATNFTLLKTIMGMIKIRNGALEVDARAVMVDKLLRGALGIAFDWANAKVTAEITSGKASININIADGDPEEYVATESTARPDYAAADENTGTAETLTYTWTLTEDQAKAQSFTFELRERNGDTADYGKYINLNSETAAEGATWTRGEGESGEHTLTLTLDLSKKEFTWLKEKHRADASKNNLDMAQNGELPLRLTAHYDVNTANVNGTLQLGSDGATKAEEAITAGSDPVYTKEADGSLTLNPNIQNISLMDNASLIDSVKELMNGFRLGAELKIYISEGVYDMGGLLSQLLTTVGVSVEGLDEVTTLNWTISEPFVFRLGLELLIELGDSAEDTRIALTLESDGLIIDEQNAINPGTLLGVYYTGENVLVDLTNFKIAGITLPAYTLNIDLFDLLDTMLGDMIGGLDISAVSGGFKATADKDGVTVKGDMGRYAKFEVIFNDAETGTEMANAEDGVQFAAPEAGKAYTAIVKAYGNDGRLLGSTTVSYDPATATPETGEVEGASLAPEDGTSELTNVEAIILGISSERIALEASFGAIATLLSSALSGNATVATVADVLDMLGLEIGLTMAKNEDLMLALSGLLNWNSIDGSDAEFAETTVEATNVKFDAAHSSGNTVAFSFTTVAGASGYTATMSGGDLTQPVTGTIENGIAYFNDEQIDYTTAASGGYTVTVVGKIDAPINIELSLGTSQLLGADKGEISGELDAIFGTETTEGSLDFDAKLEEYGSKVLSGLIDTLLNTRITLSLNMGMLMEDGTLDHGKVSLSDLVMLIAGDIAVSAGITLEDIVGSVDLSFEMDVTTLVLDIAMNLDLDEPESSDLLVQICSDINGVKDVLIGLYVYDNLLTLDLRALGLRAYTLQNFDYIVNLQNMLRDALLGEGGLLGQYDIDLNELISDLLNPDNGQQGEETGDGETVTPPVNATPALPEEDETIASIGIGVRNKVADGSTTFTWGAVAGVDHYMLTATAIDGTVLLNIPDISSTITEYTITGARKSELIAENGWDEDIFGKIYTVKIEAHNTLGDELHNVIGKGERQLNGAIASILGAVSMENTIIGLEVTPLIINNLLAAIAPSISINTDPINVGATVDVFNGNASAEIDLSLTYSDGGAESSTFRLGATLGIGTADELYSSAADADNEINGILDELGEDVDTIDFGTPSDEAGVDGARILYALIEALNTTDVTAHLNVKFNAGTYDVGEMLAGMGIDALDGVSLQWTFDEAQDIALSLRLALYVDTSAMNNIDDPGTYFLLDIKAEKDIVLGRVIGADGSSVENYTIRAGESIISIYGREGYQMPGTVYVDLSGIDLLGLELPVISAQYAFTDMLINEFYDIIASIMDLGQYLEASYAMGENGNVTFSWDGTGLGNGPEVKYEVSVYGFDEDGVQYEVFSPAVTSATSVTANIGSAQYVSYTVNVASFFEYGPSSATVRRDLASHTTEISVVSSNEVAQLSYVTPDDVYAEEDNVGLARVENVKFTFTGKGTARVTWDAYEGALAYRVEVRRASDGDELEQENKGNFAWFKASGLTAMQIDVSGLFNAKNAFETAFTKGEQHPMVGAEGYDYGYIVTVYAYTDERIGEITESSDMTYAKLGDYKPVAVGAANSFETMSMWFAPRATEYMNGTTGYYSVGWNGVEGAAAYSVLPYYVKRQVSAEGMEVTYPVVGSVDKGGTALGLSDLSFAAVGAEGRRSLTYYNVTYTSEYYIEAVAYDQYGNMIARGQITSGLGKISDTDKTLLPISTIEIVLDSERFGLELQIGAVLAILEGVGVELPIDLRGFDIDAALGLDTTLEATVVSDKIVEIEGDVDAVQLKGLADGEHTLTVEYTNSGNVTTRKSVSFTWTSGVVSSVKGDFDIGENGIVRQSMRRNGDYVFTLTGSTNASAEFTTSRTLNLGITGDIVKPVSGTITVTNAGESKIGVTDGGRTLFWEPVANAVNYTVSIVLKDGEGGAILTERTFEGLEAFVQDVDFTARGYYEITVEAFDANGKSLGTQSANVEVTGDSGLGITIFIPYDEIVVGASDSAGEGEGAESYRDALKAYVDQKIENAVNVNHNNYTKLLDLLEHYLSNFSLSLELGVESFTTEINLQTIINSVLGAVGVTTEIGAPIYINTDDIETMSVALNVSWSLNWDDPAASFATIELTYTGSDVTDKVLLGAYLYNSAVYVDLNGLGLFGLKLRATSLYEFLTNMIVETIEGLFEGIDMGEGLDFSQAVTSLLGEYPELDLVAIAGASSQGVQAAALAAGDETAADESAAAESESAGGTDMTRIITGLLNAVSLNSTNVFVKANTAILDAITSTLLGVKLGVDLDLVLELPLLKGSIPAELRLDNITFDAMLTIAALDSAPSVPANVKDDGNEEGGYFIDLDAEGTGAELLTALLGNLPLNLTVELANATMDSYAYYNYSPNNDWLGHGTYPAGTRIEIEVVQNSKTYGSDYNLASSFTASRGDIVVAVATTNKAEQDSSGGGYKRYLIVAHIDMDAGSLSVRLCERAIVLQAWAALGIVAEIDLGAGVSVLGGININIAAIPLNINIALDLADLLGGVLDGLLETINGLAGGTDTASEASVPETTASGTGARVDGINAEFVTAGDKKPVDGTQSGVQIRWKPAYQLNEDGTQGAEYDFYTVTVTNSRNGRIIQQLDQRSGSPGSGGYYRIELKGTYYEAYEVSVVGGMDPSGFAAAFADLDIWKLLGGGEVKGSYNSSGEFVPSDTGNVVTTTGGIYMNLNSTGEMNLTVRFDPYEINKAVDALFGSIFGANSALDLTTASLGGGGTFGINYLAFMWWDRAGMSYRRLSGEPQGNKSGITNSDYEDAHDTKAATDPTSTLDSLESQLRGLLADLLEQMNIAVDTAGAKLSGAYLRNRSDSLVWARWEDSPWGATPILLSIFMKFIPISIWNEAELNVNMTNGVLTNISFLGQDTGDAVLRYNGKTNDVYVYYAQTLYSPKTSGQYGSDGYGMQSNWTYNPFNYQVGYHVDMDGDGKADTLNTPYKTTNSGAALTKVAYKVYTYAIPYGSIDENSGYYFQDVGVHKGTGKGGTDFGYGGRSPAADPGNILYRRGDVIDPNTGAYTHGEDNQWTRGQNRDAKFGTLESYTRIEIYNSMSNVSADNAYDNSAQNNGGVVSWGNIPNRIVYDPYSMGNAATAAKELWNDLFSQRGQLTARWQNGKTFQRRPIYFHMANGTEITADNYQKVLGDALKAGKTFGMYAIAYFASPATTARLNITVVPLQTGQNENDEIVSVDAWNLHYYDAIPEYVIVTTEGGQRKRYRVSRDKTEVDRGDADAYVQGIQTQGAGYAQGYENQDAFLTFRNGEEIDITVNYLDSTLADPSITVDMYTISGEIVDGVETTAAQKIAAQIENLVLNYTDGDIATSETAITWGGGELNENTPVTSEKYPKATTLGAWLEAFEKDESNINGDTIYLNATANIDATLPGGASGGAAAFMQTMTVTVYIPSKQPNKINVHGAADNTVVLNPYDYYMYLVTGDDSYNPLPLNVDVTYASGETESVGVLWRGGEDGKLKYADDYVTTWYTLPETHSREEGILKLQNDDTLYDFNWSGWNMAVQINSGVISGMSFLEGGEWKESPSKNFVSGTARVTFTSGHVLELPVVVRQSASGNSGYAYIGYNVDVYQRTGALVEYDGCKLKQSFRITYGA